jgi:hypothetical protein
MAIVLRYLPAYGLAVYDTPTPTAPDDGPMIAPGSYASRVKFHSNLYYPSLAHQFDASVTLPAQTNITGSGPSAVATGTYATGKFTLGAHLQSGTPIIKGMLLNHEGANRPLQGTFPVQATGNMCRTIDLGIEGGNVVLLYAGFTQAGGAGFVYPSIGLNLRIWVFNWQVGGEPRDYDASLPLLKVESTRVRVGRGIFDTDRDYMRSATGAENTLLTAGETWTLSGSNGATTFPSWGWRYSVDGYTKEGQASGSGAASFTRIKLP